MMVAETGFLKQVFDKVLDSKNTQFVYPMGPFPSDMTGQSGTFGWWPADGNPSYIKTFGFLSQLLDKEGPFDGAVGFSQGASVCGLLATLLERPRGHPQRPLNFTTNHKPLRFVVSYSGFREEDPRFTQFYIPRSIKTPIIHFVCATDPVVTPESCMRLVQACADSEDRVVVYAGSGFHRVPRTKMTRLALTQFLEDVLV
jgi:hypothetical protein